MITYYFSFFLFRYSSFPLFKTLQDHDTLACGTVRKLRAKFPATMVNKKLTRGEVIHMTKDGVVGMRLRDKKDVFFLSTIHRPHLFSTKKADKDGEIVMKDNIVTEYNKNMGFVDKNDQILAQHSLVRKCTKWTTKVFFHLFEESLFNAHILYKASPEPLLDFNDFKITFVKETFKNLGIDVSSRPKHGHFPQKIPPRVQSSSRYTCPDCPRQPGPVSTHVLDNIMFVII